MGREKSKTLLLHKGTGQWYRTGDDGKRHYYGKDQAAALRRWISETDKPFDFLTAEANGTGPRGRFIPDVDPSDLTGPSLTDILKVWKSLKKGQGLGYHSIDNVSHTFKFFASYLRNKKVVAVTDEDFSKYRRHVDAVMLKKSFTSKWANDCHSRVEQVIKEVMEDKPRWSFPVDVLKWAALWDRKAYQAPKENRKRLPVSDFKKLLAVADNWAKTAVNGDQDYQQKGEESIHQAKLKRLEGLRFRCILRLACQCSLGNVDHIRITWDNVKLDGKVPHLDFPRTKPSRQTGIAIDRLIPLLPSTVKALRDLKKADGRAGVIFRSAANGPYLKGGFRMAVDKIFDEAGVTDFTFKHLRNVASSLRKREKMATEMSDAILGHSVAGTSQFYEEDVDETYLIDLINVVGREYFGGEQVKTA